MVRRFAGGFMLALQVQQYHPGWTTDLVLPNTRSTVTTVSACMQPSQIVHFIELTSCAASTPRNSGRPSR
jgi:hypothetical protein